MISSVKLTASSFTNRKLHLPKPQSFLQPTSQNVKQNLINHSFSSQKPLYISSIENFSLLKKTEQRGTECKAYEADQSRPLEINIDLLDEQARLEAAQRLRIGIYFATWWALNVVFNIYNKKVLNAFPYPWLTSTLSLATGSLMMLISWATRIADAPKTDLEFWKTLFPVRSLKFFYQLKFFSVFLCFVFWLRKGSLQEKNKNKSNGIVKYLSRFNNYIF